MPHILTTPVDEYHLVSEIHIMKYFCKEKKTTVTPQKWWPGFRSQLRVPEVSGLSPLLPGGVDIQAL